MIFAVEFVQFILLLVIIWFLLRRTVGKDLKERRERVAAQVEEANRAGEAYAEARAQAAAIAAEARVEAQRIMEKGRADAEQERRAGLEQIEGEAAALILQAQQTVEAEKNRVISEASEQLVNLIGMVARRFLEEALTDSERRALTQKLILDRLKEMEGTTSQQ